MREPINEIQRDLNECRRKRYYVESLHDIFKNDLGQYYSSIRQLSDLKDSIKSSLDNIVPSDKLFRGFSFDFEQKKASSEHPDARTPSGNAKHKLSEQEIESKITGQKVADQVVASDLETTGSERSTEATPTIDIVTVTRTVDVTKTHIEAKPNGVE